MDAQKTMEVETLKSVARTEAAEIAATTTPNGSPAEKWLSPFRFSLLIGLLLFAAYPDVLTGSRAFVFRDFGLYGYPMAHYHRECFWRGEIPLWNPLNNCGIPFLAQWAPMALYPFTLIYLLLSPLSWSLGLFCLVHLWWAALGMYYLAYRLTANRFAAAVAGLAFAFNGFSFNCLMWPNYLAALGWMPWVILLAQRAVREGGRHIIAAAVAGALQMLAGAPEVIFFTWVIISVWEGVSSLKGGVNRVAMFRRFVTLILWVTALSAAQLFPFLDLLSHSQRGAGYSDATSAMPLWGWANLLVPLFRCTQSSAGVFFQPDQALFSSYYPGVAILALAARCVVRKPQREVWMLAALAGLSLGLALGPQGYLYTWLRQAVPPLGFMNFPIKFVIIFAFVAPLLAAFGMSRCLDRDIWDKSRTFRWLTVIAALLTGLIALVIWVSYRFPGVEEQWDVTRNNGLIRGALLMIIVAILYGIIRGERFRKQILLQAGLLLVLWLDVMTHVPRQNPTVDPSIYRLGLPPLMEMTPRPKMGESRAMLGRLAIEKFHQTIVSNAFEGYLGCRLGLYDNCNLLEDMPKIDGFYSLYLPNEREVRFRLVASSNSIPQRLADFLGVSQMTAPGKYLDWTGRTTWMPIITAGQRPEFIDEREAILTAMQREDFDSSKVVYLPSSAGPFIKATNQTDSKVLRQHVTAHLITADVEANQPSLMVVAQTFYHPWKAYVDGVPAVLWQANLAYQALEVPAGRHEVKLAYEDRIFRSGGILSLITFVGTGILWFLSRRRCEQKG